MKKDFSTEHLRRARRPEPDGAQTSYGTQRKTFAERTVQCRTARKRDHSGTKKDLGLLNRTPSQSAPFGAGRGTHKMTPSAPSGAERRTNQMTSAQSEPQQRRRVTQRRTASKQDEGPPTPAQRIPNKQVGGVSPLWTPQPGHGNVAAVHVAVATLPWQRCHGARCRANVAGAPARALVKTL